MHNMIIEDEPQCKSTYDSHSQFPQIEEFRGILLNCLSLFKLNIVSEIEELILNSR